MEDSTKRAIDSYEKDARFRATARSAVARAMQDHGPIDPERADQGAYDIALQATVFLLQHIYENDAELVALRYERDRYKELALSAAQTRLSPLVYEPGALYTGQQPRRA